MEKQVAAGPHAPSDTAHHKSFWLWVMCLTGVDYFSTLGYQPSIAFEATGILTPFATIILVLVTLLGALPVYSYVAGKSHRGQGSIAMLEQLLRGWPGKILVLVLLGFAATDFVITKTLSAADAAVHLIENPLWPEAWKPAKKAVHAAQPSDAAKGNVVSGAPFQGEPHTSPAQVILTMGLLMLLGAMFMRGFKEVIGLAIFIVGGYLLLNLIVIGSSVLYLSHHGEAIQEWFRDVQMGKWYIEHNPLGSGSSWGHIALVCMLLFPKLALGLSGFETGVAVMPLVKGDPGDTEDHPRGRIRNTRKLLVTAALIMSVYLLSSSVVVSTLIPHDALAKGGKASGRALAYLAHGEDITTKKVDPGTGQYVVDAETGKIQYEKSRNVNPIFGEIFGTVYDLSTVIILWFAGASAMAGLLNLVPQYLPRYGMAPDWTRAFRPLVMLFTLINLFVTWRFEADVDAQGAAYATGVLVLMTSACLAGLIDCWRQRVGHWYRRISWRFLLITMIFIYTTATNIWEKPDGLKIASWFILAIIISSAISRFTRVKELRFQGFDFVDDHSRFLWNSLRILEFPVLVPHRPGVRSLEEKEAIIRKEHHLGPEIPIVFVEALLGDTSNFYQTPCMEVKQEEGRFIIKVDQCASIPHTIAAIALELSKEGKPPEIHFGWSNESPMAANLSFLLFGEGNVPWMVRELILQAEPNPERQPKVFIG